MLFNTFNSQRLSILDMSSKEYSLAVPSNDFDHGLEMTKSLVRKMIRGLIRLVGPVKVRVTIDAEMKQLIEPGKKRDSGFRSRLRHINSESEIPELMNAMFNQIETAVEHYNEAGMSGCYLSKIKGVRLLAVRYVV